MQFGKLIHAMHNLGKIFSIMYQNASNSDIYIVRNNIYNYVNKLNMLNISNSFAYVHVIVGFKSFTL